MTDSESKHPLDRRPADSLPPADSIDGSAPGEGVDDDSPRARRASARAVRQAANDKRRAERAAAKAFAASKRQAVRKDALPREAARKSDAEVSSDEVSVEAISTHEPHVESTPVVVEERVVETIENVRVEPKASAAVEEEPTDEGGTPLTFAARLAAASAAAQQRVADARADTSSGVEGASRKRTEASEQLQSDDAALLELAKDREQAAACLAEAQAESVRIVDEAKKDAAERIARAEAEVERLLVQSRRDAKERISRAVAAARSAVEEKLREAERAALEWVDAAAAEDLVDHPTADVAPDEEQQADQSPEEVNDDVGAAAPTIRKRVVRRK